ncbi:MAG TPA: CocE/NonD family hydrolase [Candidatus Lokiarchaeia archaeon]|nr:CocE/NonD family hydrolase [Candidatus Lokiarchaeia archaeon]
MAYELFKFDKEPRRKIQYKDIKTTSIYIPMSDGVKIAAEIILPKELPEGTRLPALLVQTRYWRAHYFRALFRLIFGDQLPLFKHIIKLASSYGIGIVYLDVRGSGASTGTYKIVNTGKELTDCKEVMDWIITQPWSDGNILAWGISYLAMAAELAGIHGHLALKGLLPSHGYWDIMMNCGAPAGVINTSFLRTWSEMGKSLDKNSMNAMTKRNPVVGLVAYHVKPVDDEKDGHMIQEAMKDHSKNIYPFDVLKSDPKFRDDAVDAEGSDVSSLCIWTYKDKLEESGLPYYVITSWLDAGVADGGFDRFLTIKNKQRVVVGDWNHGTMVRANQFRLKDKKVSPSIEEQVAEWADYFDRCIHDDVPDEKIIYYYTMVEEKWKKTDTWPPANHEMQNWYLSTNHELTMNPSEENTGADEYTVNFNATTGKFSRWSSGRGYRIKYPNRAKQDKLLLTYTSQPLVNDMEITGNAIACFTMASTHEDGIIIVYMEDVDEKGRVTYITEGLLRLIQRKIADPEDLPYKSNMIFHSFLSKDAMPMVKGEFAEIKFGLFSTSVLIRKGHKLRIAIAGADKDSFDPIHQEGTPVLTFGRNASQQSFIQFPVIPKNE